MDISKILELINIKNRYYMLYYISYMLAKYQNILKHYMDNLKKLLNKKIILVLMNII